ncbi:MAG TPA: TfoX/Sxy family protein [Pseudomonas sp.]|jgi:DNA transformation protein|nr:TfoX/Sxy family protein [Pseudomonas sp.]
MNDELLRLKNLGKTSAQWLHASGIHSLEDLRRLGSVGAYRAVRARGFRVSRVLLYAIEGALLDIPWNQLSSDHKQALNQALDCPPPPPDTPSSFCEERS